MLLISSMKYATCSILSTVLSSVIVSPLDVLRTRNQAFNMYKKGAVSYTHLTLPTTEAV